MLDELEIIIQLTFCFFSVLFFMIAYNEDTFGIKTELNWDQFRKQYISLYGKGNLEQKHFPAQIASFCYEIQELIISLQQNNIYFICVIDLFAIIYMYLISNIKFWGFFISMIIGNFISYVLCYYINTIQIGTVIKVPLRDDPLRWAYGNGFFLSLFSLGIVIISGLILNQFNLLVFKEQFFQCFIFGALIPLYLKREEQVIIGKGMEITAELQISDNFQDMDIQNQISYQQKFNVIVGQIMQEIQYQDCLGLFLFYFILPYVRLFMTQVKSQTSNYYSIVLIINFFAQFILSFFISSSAKNGDIAKNTAINVRYQIIFSCVFSIMSLALLVGYDAQLMSIATFGLIISVLTVIYLEYLTNHSYPLVRNINNSGLNAPMLNLFASQYIGDMGQLFISVIVAFLILLAYNLNELEGLYALLTGLLVNTIVMMSTYWAGTCISNGTNLTFIAQVDYIQIQRTNLATSNYPIYLKSISNISQLIITFIMIPQNNINYFALLYGATLYIYCKGINQRSLKQFIETNFQNININGQVQDKFMWPLISQLLILFISLFVGQILKCSVSIIWGLELMLFISNIKNLVVGGSLQNARLIENSFSYNRNLYLTHLFSDLQGRFQEWNGQLFVQIGIILFIIIQSTKYI
ncbi:hypothetical protein pb186bvf_006749 [Paramecium bursaria]